MSNIKKNTRCYEVKIPEWEVSLGYSFIDIYLIMSENTHLRETGERKQSF